MKNAIKILSLLTLVLFAACKKDDDKTTSEDGIVGKWKLTEMTCDDGTTSTEVDGTSYDGTFTATGKDYTQTVEFRSDGTYTSSGGYTAVVTTNFFGQTSTAEATISDFLQNGTYEVNGDMLTGTASTGETGTYDILTLSASTLKFKVVLNRVQDLNGQGTSTTTGTYYFTMDRQ
jgi:hypothetical protein